MAPVLIDVPHSSEHRIDLVVFSAGAGAGPAHSHISHVALGWPVPALPTYPQTKFGLSGLSRTGRSLKPMEANDVPLEIPEAFVLISAET